MNQNVAHFQANGFSVSNTGVACDPEKTPDQTALLCSPGTYVASNADQTSMFADDLHPTTRLHTLFATIRGTADREQRAGALTGRRTRPGSASVRISKQSFCSSGSVPIAQKAAQRTARRAKDRDAIEHHCGPRGGCAGGCSVPARSCSSGGVGSAQNGSSGVNVK